MKRFALKIVIVGICAGLWLFSDFFGKTSKISLKTGPIAHEIYVWQRIWRGEPQQSLAKISSHVAAINILAGEISWPKSKHKITAKTITVAYDSTSLQSLQKPITLSVRVPRWTGSANQHRSAGLELQQFCSRLISKAREAKLPVVGLQIDYDCPSSKLTDYQRWLTLIREVTRKHDLKLSITSLPSWLSYASFKILVQQLDFFVLQVHGLERPRHRSQSFQLCHESRSLRWIRQAAGLGRDFQVALPCYGYELAFDKDGRFAKLAAETHKLRTPKGGSRRRVLARVETLQGILKAIEKQRPVRLLSVIWFRLPCRRDRLCWPLETWTAVRTGQPLSAQLKTEIIHRADGLIEVLLKNSGNAEASPPLRVRLRWSEGQLFAADAVQGYVIDRRRPHSLILKRAIQPLPIAPNRSRVIAWLRFTKGVPHVHSL